jgi:hypothetical protein
VRRVQPVHLNDKGDKVRRLHECLLFLIRKQGSIEPEDRNILRKQIAPEVRVETFGPMTAEHVYNWQDMIKETSEVPGEIKRDVRKNRDVDEPTAKALNWLLGKLGAFRVSRAKPAALKYERIPKSVLQRLRASSRKLLLKITAT